MLREQKPANSRRWLAGLLPLLAVAVLVGGVAGNASLRAARLGSRWKG